MKPFIVLSLFLPACIIHSSARAQPQNDNTIVLTSPRNRVPEARRNEKPRPFIPPKDIVRTDPMLEEDIESLLQAYPQCREGYVNYCLDGEIRIPCTNLCWYRCRGGETWRDGACHREKSICNAYQNCVVDARYANKRCQEHHPDYRMPNIDEFLYLLHECRINTSNIRGDEWCPAFHRGNLKYVMNLKGLQYISLWLNQGYITEDGTMTYSWMARGSLTKNEKIQLFVIGSYAVAQTACVREQADF